jgi:hypothetical protein
MHNSNRWRKNRKNTIGLNCFTLLGLIFLAAWFLAAQAPPAASANDEDAVLARCRRVEVASVSDAIEQLLGKRMYKEHSMYPYIEKLKSIQEAVGRLDSLRTHRAIEEG